MDIATSASHSYEPSEPRLQQLPLEEELQLKLLASLMRDEGTALTFRNKIAPKHFSGVRYGKLLSTIWMWQQHFLEHYKKTLPQDWYRQYVSSTLEVIADENMRNHQKEWFDWFEYQLFVAPLEADPELQKVVTDWVVDREVSLLAFNIKSKVGKVAFEDMDIQGAVADISSLRMGLMDDCIVLGEDPEAEIDMIVNQPARDCLPLGLPELDGEDTTKGGMARRELWVLAAPTNRGKSRVSSWLGARHAAKGRFVVHITLEQRAAQVAAATVTSISGTYVKSIRENPVLGHKVLNSLAQAGGKYVVKEMPAKRTTLADVESFLESVSRKYDRNPDVIIIDYADLMNTVGDDKEYIKLEALYTELRGLAHTWNALVVTPSQINREGAGATTPKETHMSGAYGKAAPADGVLTICQSENEARLGLIGLHAAKNRHGPKGWTVMLGGSMELCNFTPRPDIRPSSSTDHGEDLTGGALRVPAPPGPPTYGGPPGSNPPVATGVDPALLKAAQSVSDQSPPWGPGTVTAPPPASAASNPRPIAHAPVNIPVPVASSGGARPPLGTPANPKPLSGWSSFGSRT